MIDTFNIFNCREKRTNPNCNQYINNKQLKGKKWWLPNAGNN